MMEAIIKFLHVAAAWATLLLSWLGVVILRQRSAALRGAKPSPLIEQLSFITFLGEEPQTKYYGPLFLGVLFTASGAWTIISVLANMIYK
jgi:hypothetical protein